jgi:hypothetical protein
MFPQTGCFALAIAGNLLKSYSIDLRERRKTHLSQTTHSTVIHELFHQEGAGHTAMGTATYNALKDLGWLAKIQNTNAPGSPREEKTEADNFYNSGIFDVAVWIICGMSGKTTENSK